MTRDDVLHAIIQEAAAARSALCENELVIRLDSILSLAREGLDQPSQPAASEELDRLRAENARLHDLLAEVRRRTHEVVADLS